MISLDGKTIQKLNAPPSSGTVPATGVLFKWETISSSGQVVANYKDSAGSSYTEADVSAPTPAAVINAPATTSSLGGVIIGSGLAVTSGGIVSLSAPTSSSLGGIIAGSGLSVTSGGTLSVAKQANLVTHSSGFTVAQSDCYKTHIMVGSGLAVTMPYSSGGVISSGSWVNIIDSNNSGGVVVQAATSATLNGADAGSKTITIGEGGTVLVTAANAYQCVGVFTV